MNFEQNIFSQDYNYSQDYFMGHGSGQGSAHGSAPVNDDEEDDSPVEKVSPVKPKKPSKRAARAKNDDPKEPLKDWTVVKEIALCQAWCDVSENNIVGNNMKTKGFWDAIITYFVNETGLSKGYDSIVSKWKNRVRPRIGAFCAIIHNVEENHESGTNDLDVYHKGRKKSKTSETTSGSASGGFNLNDETDEVVEETQELRPMGRDQSKAKKKSAGSSPAGQRKLETQWTHEERKVASLDQRLKSLIMSMLPDDQMNSVINFLTAKSTWDGLILYHEGPKDSQDSLDDEEDTRRSQEFSSAKATNQTECHKCGKKGHFARNCWSKTSVPSYQSPFQPKLLYSSEHKPEPSASSLVRPSGKNNGLDAESYDWDEEEVLSNDNEVPEVKALMALADEERIYVIKESAKIEETNDAAKVLIKGAYDGYYCSLDVSTASVKSNELIYVWWYVHGDLKSKRSIEEFVSFRETITSQLQGKLWLYDEVQGLDKAYDRFQKLISLLEVHGATVSNEDANQKFLRALPSSWNNLAYQSVPLDHLQTTKKCGLFSADKTLPASNSHNWMIENLEQIDLMIWKNELLNGTGFDKIRFLNALTERINNTRRTVPVETSDALVVQDNALIVQDGLRRYIAQYEPTEFALMALSLLNFRRQTLNKANLEIVAYQLGLESVEAQLVVHQKNEVVYEEKIAVLEFEVKEKDNAFIRLKKQLDETLREKDELKTKLEQFETSFKNLNKLINSQLIAKIEWCWDYGDHFNENDSSVNAVKVNGVTVVKASAGCVWRPKMTDLNNVSKDNSGSWVSKRGNPKQALKTKEFLTWDVPHYDWEQRILLLISRGGGYLMEDSPFILEAFSDIDYAGASLDRKSTTGGCQFLGSRLISWQCKKQTVVAKITTKAEYITASHCRGQVLWIQNQMLDYGYNFMQTKIYVDNESAICVVKNPVYHSKIKHIEIRHHFIRDSYEKRLIDMVKIHTDNNVADLLTKAFDAKINTVRQKDSTVEVDEGSGQPTDPQHTSTEDEIVYQKWEDRMERAATTDSSLEAEHDSDAQTWFEDASKQYNDPLLLRVKTLGSEEDSLKLMELMAYCTKLSECLEFYNKHNMVAYLEKSEGSKGFHQIIDFLNASHIKYVLIENPEIYVSLIQQFWGTATARTTDDGEVELTARIDGQVKTITEASLRRHLKLEDSDGITSLPNTEFFEQLALMGSGSGTIHKTPTRPHDSPLPKVQSLGSDAGRMTLSELTVLCTNLSNKVTSLETELRQTKQTYSTALTKLIKKVKKLENTIKANQARRRTKLVSSQSDQYEDHLKVLSAAKVLADVARKRREVANVTPYTRRKRKISTASGDISTAEEPVNTAGALKPVSTADMVQERVKDKGKAIMQESEQPRKIKKKEYQQISLDEEIAQKLYAEELAKDILDEKEEVIAEATQAHDIDWSDPAVLRYHALQNRSFSVAEVRKNMVIYLKNQAWDQIQSFIPMDSEKERGSEKKTGGSRKKTLAKKRAGEKQSYENAKRQKMKDDTEKEDLKKYLNIVPVEGMNIEVLQTKYPLIDWEIYTEDSRVYWKIIRELVKERFSLTQSTKDKEKALWVELKRLFEPDTDDLLELQKYMHDPLTWRLYDACGVHHVSTETRLDMFMLVEKDYPLTRGLPMLMLVNKLQVDQHSEIADELLKKIVELANRPRQGGLLGFRASKLSTVNVIVSTASTNVSTASIVSIVS
ncbi:putative ribonuclease H-like domain-containing protein [Tanacetum coccineum]